MRASGIPVDWLPAEVRQPNQFHNILCQSDWSLFWLFHLVMQMKVELRVRYIYIVVQVQICYLCFNVTIYMFRFVIIVVVLRSVSQWRVNIISRFAEVVQRNELTLFERSLLLTGESEILGSTLNWKFTKMLFFKFWWKVRRVKSVHLRKVNIAFL